MAKKECCCRCAKPFADQEPVAAISGRIMGDTYTDLYYWCQDCNLYTLRIYRDVFVGEETRSEGKPISREEGNHRVALIRRCEEDGNDRCRCQWHRTYFGEILD